MSDPVVRCSELQLTDDRGRVRARLSMLEDQPVFELLTGEGEPAVRISAESDGGHIVVHDRSGRPRLEATMDEDDPVVRLLDATGTRRLSAVVTERGGFIALRRPCGEPNLMIAGMEGTGPVVACFIRRDFKPLLVKAKLPEVAFHSLRHSSNSFLIEEGADPLLVAKRNGHSALGGHPKADTRGHFKSGQGRWPL